MSVEQDPITDEDQIKHLKETKQFWKLKSNVGRKKLFETPELLLKAANEYFTWIDENPLEEETLYHHAGVIRKVMKAKKRPYTVRGLCLYLRVAPNYLRSFKGGIKTKQKWEKRQN